MVEVSVKLAVCSGCGRLFYKPADAPEVCRDCERPARVKVDLSLFPPRTKRTRCRRKP